eukprot:TRINITY_DN15926_c0_g2_i1.p1 TRINITY_DN15926_c0_g2~~TRINITY_DN15926_c0_g2_i1.p1  ORF type:complete len:1350 (+),score=246.18 TRINITY_DN15926_c0_g2_i1:1707-5756(+)
MVIDGFLTVSDCIGFKRITVKPADVKWNVCNLGSWRVSAPDSDGYHTMEFIASSSSTSFGCLTSEGELRPCTQDLSQLHSLDHFPLSVSKWTGWTNTQLVSGICAAGQGQDLTKLTTHQTVGCPHNLTVMRSIRFESKQSCDQASTHEYRMHCPNVISQHDQTIQTRYTACVHFPAGADLGNWRLDGFKLECPVPMALKSFKFKPCANTADSWQYEYTCRLVPGFGNCELKQTDWTTGANGTLEVLASHKMQCDVGQALQGFVLESKVPVSEPGAGEIHYLYACCKIPISLPISFAQADSPLPGAFESWEGSFCPSGRLEGRLRFDQSVGFDHNNGTSPQLQYDELQGRWCVGSQVCVLEGPAHPIELSRNKAAAFEASPTVAFTGSFEGRGVADFEVPEESEEDGGGGLLSGGASRVPAYKQKKRTYEAGDYTLDSNFQSTVEFQPWTPSDCDDASAPPTEGGGTGAPTDRCYLAFCKARNENGIESYNVESPKMVSALADAQSLGQEGVGAVDHPCSHAFYDTTARKDLSVMFNPAENIEGPGLTGEALYWCSKREIERDLHSGIKERNSEGVQSSLEYAREFQNTVCMMFPELHVITAPLGAGVSTEAMSPEEVCAAVVNNVLATVQHVNNMVHINWQKNYERAKHADCDDVQEGLQRMFCDLYCIEDAVKKGDKSILESIGNLYDKIKLTTKEMFDFYIGQVLDKMGVFEGKVYKRFDGIEADIAGLGDYVMAASQGVEDQVKQQSGEIKQKLEEIEDKQKGSALISERLSTLSTEGTHSTKASSSDGHKIDSVALSEVQAELSHFAERTSKLIEEAILQVKRGSLDQHGTRELLNFEAHLNHRAAAVQRESLKGSSTLADVKNLATQLTRRVEDVHAKLRWGEEGRKSSVSVRAAESSKKMLGLVQKMHASSSSHLGRIREEVKRMSDRQSEQDQHAGEPDASAADSIWALLRGQQLLTEEIRVASVRSMLVEFDRQWVAISHGVNTFLAASEEHMGALRSAADQANAYIGRKSSQVDYPSLLAEYRRVQTKRRATKSVLRSSFEELEKRLTLLANVLVDGGLLSTQIALTASKLPREAAVRIVSKTAGNTRHPRLGEARHFFSTEGLAALREELASSMRSGLPSQLLSQTQSAFRLANDLSLRHKSLGMKEESSAVEAMHAAWSSVQTEFETYRSMLEEPLKDETGFTSRLLGTTLNMLLPSYAMPPPSCLKEGDAHYTIWAVLRASAGREKLLLVSSPGSLLTHEEKSFSLSLESASWWTSFKEYWGWRSQRTGAASLKPRICERTGDEWKARELSSADGELSLCSSDIKRPCSFYVDTSDPQVLSVKASFFDLGQTALKQI